MTQEKGIEYAIACLSRDGVRVSNLYKFFTPEMAPETVKRLGLTITPQELSSHWQHIKSNL